MSSAFERALEGIAKDRTANGGPSLDNLLDAIIAANDDRREATADTDKRLLNLSEAFHAHVSDKPIQNVTEAILDYTREDTSDRQRLAEELVAYKQQIKAAVDAVAIDLSEYRGSFKSPRRAKAEDGEAQIEGDMQRAWRVGKWVIMVACVALLTYGVSFWADSCSRAKYWGATAPTITVTTPAPTQGGTP